MDDLLLSRDKKTLIQCAYYVSNCVIPDGVVAIGDLNLNGLADEPFVYYRTEKYTENHGRYGKFTSTRSVRADNQFLKSVVIPSTVRYIRRSVFDRCVCLKAIAFPDSVVEIAAMVFHNCSSLEAVRMSNNILRVYSNAFKDTPFSKNMSNWKDGVLYAGPVLTGVKQGLVECKVLPGTRVIAGDAFSFDTCGGAGNCSLAAITIPDTVINIGCGFESTALYKDESNWKDNALYIDNCLIRVKSDCFIGEQEVKKGTRVIAESALENCLALTGIILPDSLVTIGAKAFKSCALLASMEIPYGVFYVGEEAFGDCTILSAVSLPSSLEYMGMNVFEDCKSLASIKVFATKPPLVNETLGNINKSIPVYVPEESIEAYKAADGWCKFTNFQPLKDKEKKKTTSVKEEKVEVTTKPTASETPKAEPKAEKTAAPVVEKVETVVDTVAPEAPKAEPKHEKPTAPAAEEPKTAAASATSPAKPNLSDVKKSAETKDYLVTQGNDGSITVYRKNGNEWEESDNAKGSLRELAAQVSFDYDKSWTTRQFGAKLIDFVNKLS